MTDRYFLKSSTNDFILLYLGRQLISKLVQLIDIFLLVGSQVDQNRIGAAFAAGLFKLLIEIDNGFAEIIALEGIA